MGAAGVCRLKDRGLVGGQRPGQTLRSIKMQCSFNILTCNHREGVSVQKDNLWDYFLKSCDKLQGPYAFNFLVRPF